MLKRGGMDPNEVYARSARPNEKIDGKIAYMDDKAAQIITKGQMVLVDPRNIDAAAHTATREVQCVARHQLGTPEASKPERSPQLSSSQKRNLGRDDGLDR